MSRPRRKFCDCGRGTTHGNGDKAICERCHLLGIVNQFRRARTGIKFVPLNRSGNNLMASRLEVWLCEHDCGSMDFMGRTIHAL